MKRMSIGIREESMRKSKKKAAALFLFALVSSMIFAFIGCGDTDGGNDGNKECTQHDYGAWTVTTAATCKTGGTQKRSCKKCTHFETRATEKRT